MAEAEFAIPLGPPVAEEKKKGLFRLFSKQSSSTGKKLVQ